FSSRRRHTRFSRDWSSDVCSSDLGVIERSHVMDVFPASFASPWTAMVLMVVLLVILGMIMDAFGAIILVSVTFATVAYDSGIHQIGRASCRERGSIQEEAAVHRNK